jgi:hypothetical protein
MTKLRFIVIPTKNNYEEYSEEIVSKIKDVEDCTADLDKNYNETLNSRVSKYKKNNKNVITIGLSEVEHNTIMIHFNGTRPKTMELNEFVALLESYDEEDTENDESSSSSSDDDDVGEMFQKQKSKSKKLESESKEIEEEQEGCTIS